MGNATCCAVRNVYKNQEQVIQPIVETNSKGRNSNNELKLNYRKKEDMEDKEEKEDTNSFEYKLLDSINRVRTAPYDYCEGLKNIKSECSEIENKLIYITPYQKKVVVNGGIPTIDDAIETLKATKPMKKLKISHDLRVDFFKRSDLENCTEDDAARYLEKKIKELKQRYSNVNVIVNYFEDSELCTFLNLTDPFGKNYKREIILNPDLTLYGTSYCKLKDRMFTSITIFAN